MSYKISGLLLWLTNDVILTRYYDVKNATSFHHICCSIQRDCWKFIERVEDIIAFYFINISNRNISFIKNNKLFYWSYRRKNGLQLTFFFATYSVTLTLAHFNANLVCIFYKPNDVTSHGFNLKRKHGCCRIWKKRLFRWARKCMFASFSFLLSQRTG
jgi:hypothetical protein